MNLLKEANLPIQILIIKQLCDLETNDKNYIVYTDNSKCEDGSTKLYAASYIFNEDDRVLNNIETEEEWKMIEAILSYLTRKN